MDHKSLNSLRETMLWELPCLKIYLSNNWTRMEGDVYRWIQKLTRLKNELSTNLSCI